MYKEMQAYYLLNDTALGIYNGCISSWTAEKKDKR